MARLIKSGKEAREALLAGAKKMADVVGSTLGPSGRNVAVHSVPGLIPGITRDGVTVAREIVLPDPFEDCAAQVMKDASQRTVADAGDGTTTSVTSYRSIIPPRIGVDRQWENQIARIPKNLPASGRLGLCRS